MEARVVAKEGNVCPYFHVEQIGVRTRPQTPDQSYQWVRNRRFSGHWEPIKK